MQYLPHYDRHTGIPKGSYPTAEDVLARANMIREAGLVCVGETWDPGNGNVPIYEGKPLSYEETQVMCLKPFVEKDETKQLMDSYAAEYLRVNGRAPTMAKSGSWISVDGDMLRKKELEQFLATLKERKSFYS